MNRTKQISAKLFPYAIAVVLLANPVVSNSYAEKCVGGNPRICVDFSEGGDPVLGFDFEVTGDNLILKAGADDWRVWSQVSGGNTTPADFGSITLNPAVNTANFKVDIKNGFTGDAGAANVGSMVLDGAANPNWTGGSSLDSVEISGAVLGAITLVKDNQDPPQGGAITGDVDIVGDVTGLITVPTITLTGKLTIGDLFTASDASGGFVIDLLDGQLRIFGTLAAEQTGVIGDIGTGAFNIGTVAQDATLDLLNGVPESAQAVTVGALEGTIDLNFKDIRSNLFLRSATETGKVVDGGIVAAIFYPAENAGDFAGQAGWPMSSDVGDPNSNLIRLPHL